MSSQPRRELIKGSIRPPLCQPSNLSYTQRPASKDDLVIRNRKDKNVLVTEFSSRAVPQPFLDPGILHRRIQADQQWKLEQEKKKPTGASSSSQL